MTPYDDDPTRRPVRPRRPDWAGEPAGREAAGGLPLDRSWDDYPGGDPPSVAAGVGRAAVGRASVGRAVGSPAMPAVPYAPAGEPFARGRDVFRAGPPDVGPYEGPGRPISPVGGVPVPGAVGRAVVGRASVRPVSPSGPAGGAGGPGGWGPGGRGPGGRGPGGRGPFDRGPFGRDPDGPDGPEGPDGSRWRRGGRDWRRAKLATRRNMIIAAFAVFIMLTGVGVVGGTYYVSSVPEPSDLDLPESTTVYFANGRDVMAKLGDETRYMLQYAEMLDTVKWSVISAEDRTFRTNEGIDFKGVLRAAWANFTGGEIQGASTITQQYARTAYELQGVSYARKLKEAVMAWKLDDKYSKDEILEFYLNTVPFGRGAHGIEAAAQAFFGKSASTKAPQASQLTLAEAMVLVAMIKQPEPQTDDPENFPGYDPTRNAKAEQNSRERWNYIRDGLVNPLKYLTQDQADKLEYPTTVRKYDAKAAAKGLDKPTGLVVSHALSELVNSPDSPFRGWSWEKIRNGGYKIITTIDPGAQRAAEEAADDTLKTSPMNGQPAYLQAALVGVQPGTGRVVAYFGGHNGAGSDYASWFIDEEGEPNGVGRYPPGSSFKIYSAAAALGAGVSLNSYWPSKSPTDFDGRKIRNASSCPTGKDQPCSLLNSIIASLNVPFYAVTREISPGRVIEMARAAGIDNMWTDARARVDLTKIQSASEVTPSKFDTVVGIGQYPITVLDHANGAATFAASGLRARAHFVYQVRKGDEIVYGERVPTGKEPRILNQAQINDLHYALSQVPTSRLTNGWDSGRKTGTWEYNQSSTQNAHAWMVGFTKKLAAAVWVGNEKEERAIKTKSGQNIFGSTLPGPIWRQFIEKATAAMKLDRRGTDFSKPSFVGEVDPPGSLPSPTPSQPPIECQIPGLPSCPTDPPEGGGGGGNGGGGGPGHGFPTSPPPLAVAIGRFDVREPPGWSHLSHRV